jgi:hypoxanthine phosphoribosyltransferase
VYNGGHDSRRTVQSGAYYLSDVEHDTDHVLAWATKTLRENHVRYDTLVGTGLSGALIVPLLARALHKNWAIVRKADDKSTHSGSRIEGTVGRRWVFVDDLIATGSTRHHVKDMIRDFAEYHDFKTTYVGDLLYETGVYRAPREADFWAGTRALTGLQHSKWKERDHVLAPHNAGRTRGPALPAPALLHPSLRRVDARQY